MKFTPANILAAHHIWKPYILAFMETTTNIGFLYTNIYTNEIIYTLNTNTEQSFCMLGLGTLKARKRCII